MAFIDLAVLQAFEGSLDGAVGLGNDVILARLDTLHIDLDVAGAYSVVGPAAREVGSVGGRDQRFRGCATGIDAGAPEASAFDDGNFHSRTCQPSCEWWPSLPGSDDNSVVGCHVSLLLGEHATGEMC